MDCVFQHTAARRRLLYGYARVSTTDQFQHTAARRRLRHQHANAYAYFQFQHTAARRRLPIRPAAFRRSRWFQHTAARRRLHPKGASHEYKDNRFNTQPPEGGCCMAGSVSGRWRSFNTQPPEGGCRQPNPQQYERDQFQHTAARRRLRPRLPAARHFRNVSTHSRPKAAAAALCGAMSGRAFQHTAARRRLLSASRAQAHQFKFQHTAARRRLHNRVAPDAVVGAVSTHSRPKAAACRKTLAGLRCRRFNTQPPEGGCGIDIEEFEREMVSTHSRPKAAARRRHASATNLRAVSTHSRPKAAAHDVMRYGRRVQVSTHSRPKAAAPYPKIL